MMRQEPGPRPGQSSEYTEQQIIEAIARSRYPGRGVQDIRPGFDAGGGNYVWVVILESTGKPFENTLTTVDSNDIRAWHERQAGTGLPGQSLE